MSAHYLLSNDGEVWYEAFKEQLTALLDDPAEPECIVDMLPDSGYWITSLSCLRALSKQPPSRAMVDWDGQPVTLFGLPVVFTEEMPK